ncbi:MAG: hypothetical protein HY301_08615, partial [Verrucomicrobia bacterium]|nr:hypothetical protein [Verrucomicrobiota bacterium]
MTQPDSTPKKFADGRRSLLYSMVALFVVFNAAILVRTLRKDGTGEATTNVVNGRVLLKGTSRPELPLPLDPACAKLWAGAKPTTRFYLIGANGGLGDVFVHVKSG